MHELFDEAAFQRELAGSGPHPIGLFKDYLAQGSENLRRRFEDEEEISNLVALRARLVDFVLRQAWGLFLADAPDTALLAVGGYGRGELLPHSDVDLQILIHIDDSPHCPAIGEFLTFLWDIGLKVGQSVRTLQQCDEEARKDVTVITNLTEARLLAGDEALFRGLQRLADPRNMWPPAAFFRAKRDELVQRYQRYDNSISALEPNIKTSPGGLRDIQTVAWVAKRRFGGETLHDLVAHEFLTEREYLALVEGQNLLWENRFALHLLADRAEDRLLFDYQRTLAAHFGFTDAPHSLGVEQFMQRYYRTALQISRLTGRLLQLFEEDILLADQPALVEHLNRRFNSRNGYLEVVHDAVFQRHPFALLELFHLLQQHPELKGVRATTERLIRQSLTLIDERFRNDLRTRSLFMEILRHPDHVSRELRRMNRYGVLSAYLPAFGNIVGRMQYDLFHVYTVDEHTLLVVRNLIRFADPRYAEECSLCHAVMKTLPKRELLYLGGLFHDIAKGRGGDHSKLGAGDARTFCKRHHLSDYDANLVAWLVEKHLVMSMTAQGKDINDPEVVTAFAREAGDLTRLNYLYLLTVADIKGTNPEKWNSWKAALLRTLYSAAKTTLLRGLQSAPNQDEVLQEKQYRAFSILQEKGYEHDRVVALWFQLSIEYFLNHSALEIAWQTRQILNADRDRLPLIKVRTPPDRSGTEIFLFTRDYDNLFAITTALLNQLGLNIVQARVETADDGYTIDSYQVLEGDGTAVASVQRNAEIIDYLSRSLARPAQVDLSVPLYISRKIKAFSVKTRLEAQIDRKLHRTILELTTTDRPGLLAIVGQAFAETGVRLYQARIATIGATAQDSFFVTDLENGPLSDATLERLSHLLCQRLDA